MESQLVFMLSKQLPGQAESTKTDYSDPASLPAVLVVILNYRTPNLTIECLHSLVNEVKDLPNLRVAVTDNNSGDDSNERIAGVIAKEGWEWATFMPLERNGGFAYGSNFPIRQALAGGSLPPYVLLLNPDTVVRPGAIRALVEFMEQNSKVGIAGSRLEDPDGTPQCSAFRFHTIWSEFDGGLRLGLISKVLSKWIVAPPVSEVACTTDWVAGASMMIRQEVIEQVGLMDEDYFMYYEEMDFCLQANRAGWPCWYVPESHVVHLVGQSSGVTNTKKPPKRRPKYVFDSRYRYFLKNYGSLYLVIADIAWIIGFASWRLRRFIQRKPDEDPPYLLWDSLRNSFLFRGLRLNS
ncbi:glycosyltransferase family 2 protein [Nodosilinea sp. E11]|uniref:glycosyltransferase family 2 protein n=1 Tax=Nodosilinea sp. E11 TaxID=3037479 RepID=UPI002934660B|nr:glycosyltransferase family 2 protein [Nodosilinea sp. E11]WOD38905.1 glycosyltransferase family 2 protein [Nodosilinea sp. E11]